MANKGYFETILDVQCFDLKAIESIRENPKHQEISAMRYASPAAKSAAVDSLDVVILGATQVLSLIHIVSADHLLKASDEGIRQMRDAGVISTILPLTAFGLSLIHISLLRSMPKWQKRQGYRH